MQKVIVHDNAPTDADGRKLPPADIEMYSVDANAAVAADPKRYSIVERKAVVVALSIEERVAVLETQMAVLWEISTDARADRDKKLAAKADADAKKLQHDRKTKADQNAKVRATHTADEKAPA